MAEENEKELLGTEYVEVIDELSQQTTQMGGGFFQLTQETDFEERYPNAIDDFLQTASVKEIAETAEVDQNDLKPPFNISDETITDIDQILNSVDTQTMSAEELLKLRADVEDIISDVGIPTADQLTLFIDSYTKFVAAALAENISFPTNFREIDLVSTDTSIDSFLARTGIRKLVAIRINNLVYPFITERFHVPSQLQGTLVDATGSEGEKTITFSDINKNTGVAEISAGSRILITNNAKQRKNLLQQKILIEWYSEDVNLIHLGTPLLFDLDSTHVVQIYQYTIDEVLSPGETIKIPK